MPVFSGFYCKVTRKEEIEPCKHPRCAVARSLYPNGIQNLQLRCIICKSDVPEKRARGHYKETCSAACNSVFKEWKKYVVESRSCPNCLHPHTPEQRADFQLWRKERGYGWDGVKRNTPRVEALEEMLRKVHLFIKGMDVGYVVTSSPGDKESWLLQDIEKLVDTKKQNAGTLATSGIPAPTGEHNVTLG